VSGIPFHATIMGRRFYETTMPDLVRELAGLNKNLERLIAVVEPPESAGAPPPGSAPVRPTQDSP
jgi:hypothetical protein